ncbi:MAG: hypothetical protein HKO57_16025, partial [Akkermansiaceae bacterium]|nr:hypothetical protein [Akkermansiaceae bacterium]
AGGDEHAALQARLARHFPKTHAAPAEGSARKGRKNRKNAPKPKAQ